MPERRPVPFVPYIRDGRSFPPAPERIFQRHAGGESPTELLGSAELHGSEADAPLPLAQTSTRLGFTYLHLQTRWRVSGALTLGIFSKSRWRDYLRAPQHWGVFWTLTLSGRFLGENQWRQGPPRKCRVRSPGSGLGSDVRAADPLASGGPLGVFGTLVLSGSAGNQGRQGPPVRPASARRAPGWAVSREPGTPCSPSAPGSIPGDPLAACWP